MIPLDQSVDRKGIAVAFFDFAYHHYSENIYITGQWKNYALTSLEHINEKHRYQYRKKAPGEYLIFCKN